MKEILCGLKKLPLQVTQALQPKDENAPAVFEFTTDQPGTHPCTVRAAYHDDYGNKTLEDSFGLAVAKQQSSLGIVIVAAAAIALYAIYRFMRKMK